MRVALATLIWLFDLILKVMLGYAVVFVAWLCCYAIFGISFSGVWVFAGAVAGASILGFFDGCDVILLGWAKRVARNA
jgi:hypothetical protein